MCLQGHKERRERRERREERLAARRDEKHLDDRPSVEMGTRGCSTCRGTFESVTRDDLIYGPWLTDFTGQRVKQVVI